MPPLSPRELPPVNDVLASPCLADVLAARGRLTVLNLVRTVLADERARRLAGQGDAQADTETFARLARSRLESTLPTLRPVINASGILLHTGLGRAPLATEAIEAITAVARGYCNLEIDLETGERGRRTTGVAALLRQLTGAEAATVVNNNAGATVLALRALAAGREVVVSRGQLVEIGGSFRLPEIFAVSGARLREVGTTNRTRLSDYEQAIGPETAALLRVHPSNYRVVGFTESVEIGELAQLAHARGLIAIDDIGSGALRPGMPPGILGEPTFEESLKAGADLVLGSGDKLLGGPQCGLIVGTRTAIQKVESDPLMRALRVDKLTLAALEATLQLALDPALATQRIPLWRFLQTPVADLMELARELADTLRYEGFRATAVTTTSLLGGGSLPGEEIPSAALRLEAPWPAGISDAADWAARLRLGNPSVLGRVQAGSLWLDLRAVLPEESATLLEAIRATRGKPAGGVVDPTASR